MENNEKLILSRVLHRLAMIEDDIKAIRSHVDENCQEVFEQETPFCEEAWHHISNIEIACDINSKEALDWTLFNSTENEGG